ncbi:MAG: hypothetical protein EBR10_03600 [Planctomycetes bacterium]|nr:hypothetical protein [Planctomycetota bacterium]
METHGNMGDAGGSALCACKATRRQCPSLFRAWIGQNSSKFKIEPLARRTRGVLLFGTWRTFRQVHFTSAIDGENAPVARCCVVFVKGSGRARVAADRARLS